MQAMPRMQWPAMNVIGHDHEGMHKMMPQDVGIVLDAFYNHVCDGRLA
jgi:hypothetical protein